MYIHLENFDKIPHFWKKVFLHADKNFESTSTEVGSPSPQKYIWFICVPGHIKRKYMKIYMMLWLNNYLPNSSNPPKNFRSPHFSLPKASKKGSLNGQSHPPPLGGSPLLFEPWLRKSCEEQSMTKLRTVSWNISLVICERRWLKFSWKLYLPTFFRWKIGFTDKLTHASVYNWRCYNEILQYYISS